MRQSGILPVQDQLIKTLAEEVESARKAAEETNKDQSQFASYKGRQSVAKPHNDCL